jgi:hypothetical protein
MGLDPAEALVAHAAICFPARHWTSRATSFQKSPSVRSIFVSAPGIDGVEVLH